MTDIGRRRDHNEDSHLCDSELSLFAVADGMGGHQGGDYASRLAIETLRKEVAVVTDFDAAAIHILRADPSARIFPIEVQAERPADVEDEEDPAAEMVELSTDPSIVLAPPAPATVLRWAALSAGRAIHDAAQVQPELAGMGTTLTATLFHKDRAYFVHVGDSRALLIRDGRVTQITRDHSWIAEQVRAGILTEDEAKDSKFRHIITRSVGYEPDVEIDLAQLRVRPGDCVLLCSDGMSNHVSCAELGQIIASSDFAEVPRLLIELANDRGGDDNITVVLIYVADDVTSAP